MVKCCTWKYTPHDVVLAALTPNGIDLHRPK